MALFKSMAGMANTAGTMLPGTIVPIRLETAGFPVDPSGLLRPGFGFLLLALPSALGAEPS